MGVPSTGSLSNAPTSTPGAGILPQGLWLSGDIRQNMDGDVSFYDTYPERNGTGGEIPPQYKPETRLSRLAAYNNTTPDRGTLSPSYNHFSNRTSTQQVKMSDFCNFTTTTFRSSSTSLFDNTSNMKLSSGSGNFDFVESNPRWRNPNNSHNFGMIYNLAYIDSSNDPRLAVLFISGAYDDATSSDITQTGSNYDWDTYCLDYQPLNPPDTNASIVCVDGGDWHGSSTATSKEQARMGCFYWQNGTTTNMIPYTLSGSGTGNTLIYHDDSGGTPSSTYGAQIGKAANPDTSIPPIIGDDMPISSILIYWGFSSLRARLFTVSGSAFENSSDINIYSGSEFEILSSNPGKKDKAYIGAMTAVDGAGVAVIYGSNYNSSQDGDDVVYFRTVNGNPTLNVSMANFLSSPETYLSITGSTQRTLWSSGTYKYGSKSICYSPASGSTQPHYIAAVAKSNGKIDVKYITEVGIVSSSLLDAIGVDRFGNGEVVWKDPLSIGYLGKYTEYSSSLVEDSNSYVGSEVAHFVLAYNVEDGSNNVYPRTSVIKVYTQTGDIYYSIDRESVNNKEADYETYNLWNIGCLPQNNGSLDYAGGYDALFPSDYPNTVFKTRSPYFIQPLIFHKNYSSAFRMDRSFLTIY